ncbi:MAG TPA: hypothetical protein VM141_05000, partial [Planctomycetota bacterium]|nr:hypothetical protein [Planctomycetota bacterium]
FRLGSTAAFSYEYLVLVFVEPGRAPAAENSGPNPHVWSLLDEPRLPVWSLGFDLLMFAGTDRGAQSARPRRAL